MTKARTAVLAALEKANRPLCPQDLALGLDGQCDQVTVYRALHYLEDRGLAESFVLRCEAHGTERYYTSRQGAHRHWFHCEHCHRFIDLGDCGLEGLVSSFEKETGGKVTRHTMYLMGVCLDCRSGQGGD